ncbi:inositol 2-dehydrogenase [Lentibacillus salinarum]|uniref:Inositol 2-dehydrogenase n=1 Tax=Lentibacillus salinarum TaxID=446820 RepID=A0ABW3ZXD4_9BACI
MNNIRCAVIGAGRLGMVHAKNIAERVKGAELTAVVTSRQESARKAASELGVDWWTDEPQEVFDSPDIDAVIIASPSPTHAELIIQAARRNKHIFVDKPITETLEEADEAIKEVENNKVICQVGFMRRFDPAYAHAKQRIEQGDIGEPIYFGAVSRDPGAPPEAFIEKSGGIFIDMCIHDYDIARFLMDDEIKSVQSFGTVLLHPFMKKYDDVDQTATVLEFHNGAVANIDASRNAVYGYDIRAEVVGTEGAIQIGSIQHHNNIVLKNNISYHDNIPDFMTKFEAAFLAEIEHFIACVQNGQTPRIDAKDGKKSLEIANAALQSFKKKDMVYLS